MIEVKDLRYTINNGNQSHHILDIDSLEIKSGTKTAIYGESGCGKSSFLNIIAGFIRPTSGSVVVDGVDINTLSETEMDRFRASKMDYIFQNFNLLQGYTALENIMVAMKLAKIKPDKSRAMELLEEVGLKDRMGHLPSELSFGQQQRVAIARAISKKPKIILADEPTGSLDPSRKLSMMSILTDIAKEHGSALLVVTHEIDTIKDFDNRVDLTKINRALTSRGGE